MVNLSNMKRTSATDSGYVATTYDDNKIQSNIALLGFKCAVNGSLAKYNLQDQIIDEFEDATGIDAGASTNESLTSGVYSGKTGSNPTGATSTDTSVAGYTTMVLSAASGNIVVGASGNVAILVVGGGGSGGNDYGGGAGAGGLIYKSSHALTAQTYAWVTGAGGASQAAGSTIGNVGANSTWTLANGSVAFTATGGGGGGAGWSPSNAPTGGGSGGGAGHTGSGGAETQTGQSGDSGTYGFGNAGGAGSGGSPYYKFGGGGGAGTAGGAGDGTGSGDGGTGKDYSAIFGTAVGDSGWFASGGGGGYGGHSPTTHGDASAGGGTAGGIGDNGSSAAAANNTGGGSGGSATGSGNSGAGGSGIILIRYADGAFDTTGLNLTLQSTDTTAMTEPDYADMIILMENAEGTATLNTDIKGYISEDSGVTFTQGTLVDEGTWGTNKKVLAFHDLDISAQSGTSMCYKITTHNQDSSSKKTRIHATSIGWKA
jgi:hypothetical protein